MLRWVWRGRGKKPHLVWSKRRQYADQKKINKQKPDSLAFLQSVFPSTRRWLRSLRAARLQGQAMLCKPWRPDHGLLTETSHWEQQHRFYCWWCLQKRLSASYSQTSFLKGGKPWQEMLVKTCEYFFIGYFFKCSEALQWLRIVCLSGWMTNSKPTPDFLFKCRIHGKTLNTTYKKHTVNFIKIG